MTTRFKNSTVVNAAARSKTNGNQGIQFGKPGTRPDKHKDFNGDFVKKKKEMDEKPSMKISKEATENNFFKSRNPDRAGKRKVLEFRGDAPIRFDPLTDVESYAGNNSYNSGSFRGGEPKKEVNRFYEKPSGVVEKIRNGEGNVNPFKIKIKSGIKIPV